MSLLRRRVATAAESCVLAVRALRLWTPRQVLVMLASSLGVGLLLGIATVLIPNRLFMRDIAPVWWNYPVWVATSIMSGMLIATYVRAPQLAASVPPGREERTTGRFGVAGGLLAWFAVGCPVCNKIALLAFGYTGALTWFAPLQPILAVLALIFTTIAVIWRLRGQVACPVPAVSEVVTL